MFVLVSDFGLEGPYIGQVKAVLHRAAPQCPVIDLFSDLPPFAPQPAAYLLAAYAPTFGAGSVFLAVVDPGVGGDRAALAARIDERWFVGPDNGLFAILARRAERMECWRLEAQTKALSASFHGRDLFAPAAAEIAGLDQAPSNSRRDDASLGPEGEGGAWPDDLAEIVYLDRFGNAMTGLRASILTQQTCLQVGPARLAYARTFCAVPQGQAFWYENANGLVEIAANQASAVEMLDLSRGQTVTCHPPLHANVWP